MEGSWIFMVLHVAKILQNPAPRPWSFPTQGSAEAEAQPHRGTEQRNSHK